MSDEALKPCPFCGEQCATLVIDQGDKWAHYEPSCLEVRTGYDLSDDAAWRAEAITAWNTRADDDRIEALQAEKAKLRGLVATLWCASGCSCCRDDKTWEKVSAELAEIFGVRKYDDGIGYDWYSLDEAALYRRQNDDRD